MDAGVFVLEAGPDAPRTKTRDSNPITQFALAYRKLFGLSNFIGLSQRDRFELSGTDLEDWLANPERTKEILARNFSSADHSEAEDERGEDELASNGDWKSREASPPSANPRAPESRAPTLFEQDLEEEEGAEEDEISDLTRQRMPRLHEVGLDDLSTLAVRSVILGRGFEERTLISARRLAAKIGADEGVLISYPLDGHGPEVEKAAKEFIGDLREVDYRSAVADGLPLPAGLALVDVTGLAKPMIFDAVRRLLQRDGRVLVAHTAAEIHYPLNDDIARVLDADEKGDDYVLLEALADVLTGEARPYTFDKLLNTDSDDGRRRLLSAAASPKHERLMSLIDERDYDRVDILVPDSASPRARLARLAAEVATKNFHSSSTVALPSDDLGGMLDFIADHYQRYYANGSYDFELGLTGSKLHAVACAAACSALRFSQCWYVRPAKFDVDRFTSGVAGSRYFLLESPTRAMPSEASSSDSLSSST
jgi:hypothetical protein